MPGFITDTELKQRLADVLARASVTDTPTWQSNIITDANADAYYQMLTYLCEGRGFTTAQVAAWALGPECQIELALFFVLMRTGLYKKITRDQLDFYARWIPDPTNGRPVGMLSTIGLIDETGTPILPAEGSGYQSVGLMLMNIEEGALMDYKYYPGMDF